MAGIRPANKTRCTRCGTCCRKGGPTMHYKDKKLILSGQIGYEHLITIRKGELALTPLSEKPETVENEIIKIAGKNKTWECIFYNRNNPSCAIYQYRPLECRLFECPDISKLISVIGKDTLTRADIIKSNEPILKIIQTHEKQCSVKKADDLIADLSGTKDKSKTIKKLALLTRRDLEIRQKAVSEFNLSLETELFYFGRPLFKLLKGRGISAYERNNEIYFNA